ncbi:MAG: hypothetical protein A2015_01035 [Spirochaetes bacterium GWF1_31_7]|nr:MAG: hypothetical protein A2Y30_00935 [Spirochaetes bacterium GWE1_32_154]OHD47883.1 MAG: hypothetical protein A2015_01035 [Spirochaetes bacterium GWF1_31_7]OHD48875.1 MAG: hypothetical protein A2Y29_16750 [Spirochaetes bacterium GWE2_31_10]OHD74736.1 MAG: hypothetical protein A2355_03325 [Spirochaetes bacterium RIFOXYB1_FULL_32_8]HBD94855.1 hypothetical protein [Spirochaetia bacterium]
MKKNVILMVLLFITAGTFASETIRMKNKETYSADLVSLDETKIIFLISGSRFEFEREKVSNVDFSSSNNEFEIILNDGSSMKASIVDQDDEFFTIGSSAGITPIEKKMIKQIKNPLLEKFIRPSIGTLEFHYGNVAYTTFIINDFSKSYQAYWSYENYIETNFFSKAFFGINISLMMLTPQFNIFNDFIFIIPIHFTLKYEDNFYKHKDAQHWSRNLLWHISGGMGVAIITLFEKEENITTTSVGISAEAGYGIKYLIKKFIALGINGKTGVMSQENTMLFMQSAGIGVEINF